MRTRTSRRSDGFGGTPTAGDPDRPVATSGRRGVIIVGLISGLLAIVAVALLAWFDDGGEPATETLELSAGADDPSASCPVFDLAVLADMSHAFAGTATSMGDGAVVLAVDRWYAGDESADSVRVTAPTGLEALIAGIPFEVGQRYLITATDGTVNYCGYSGPATPELTGAFDTAFGT